ncbi:hypothetical protein ACIP98_38265 [Streptomyces sp. NPDC088354]
MSASVSRAGPKPGWSVLLGDGLRRGVRLGERHGEHIGLQTLQPGRDERG